MLAMRSEKRYSINQRCPYCNRILFKGIALDIEIKCKCGKCIKFNQSGPIKTA